MPDLAIDVREVAGAALLSLNGSVDAKTVLLLQSQVNALKEKGLARFVMDMEKVKYVNSTGLSYFINLASAGPPDGSGLTLVAVQPKVKVVFDMMGLGSLLKLKATVAEALGPAVAVAAPAPAPPPVEPLRPFIPAPPPVPKAATSPSQSSSGAKVLLVILLMAFAAACAYFLSR